MATASRASPHQEHKSPRGRPKSNRSGLVRYFHRVPECLGLEGPSRPSTSSSLPWFLSFCPFLLTLLTSAPGTGMFLSRCSPGDVGNSQRNPAESRKEALLLIWPISDLLDKSQPILEHLTVEQESGGTAPRRRSGLFHILLTLPASSTKEHIHISTAPSTPYRHLRGISPSFFLKFNF